MSKRPAATLMWPFFLLSALSLSIGWGIRGNFGHEFGAMIPGALAAMAAVLASGRRDWQERTPYFGMLGALGWSFGGSISYMQVVAYTHSGHAPSVLYGFACLFVIGFAWGALGGMATALATQLDRDRLTAIVFPLSGVIVSWAIQRLLLVPMLSDAGHNLDWYDTDWVAPISAGFGVLLVASIRRRLDWSSGLFLSMAVGWWLGFGILVLGLGLRMTPPRGDNWAGCVGMTLAAFAYCWRTRLDRVVFAGLLTGIAGGLSFSAAPMLKLMEVTSGYQTNWHSIMEQSTGLMNGLGQALALTILARGAGPVGDEPRNRRWTELYAIAVILIGITYLNLQKNAGEWVKQGAMPAELAGIPLSTWFNLAYGLLTLVLVIPLAVHLRRPLAFVPPTALGQGLWLYLVFLWWMVVGNFERALVSFSTQRLVTEGVIWLNAAICSVVILLFAGRGPVARGRPSNYFARVSRVLLAGALTAGVGILLNFGLVRAVYGDRFAGHASLHIRFGPDATVSRRDSPQ